MKQFHLVLLIAFITLSGTLSAQDEPSSVSRLERRISQLEREQSKFDREIDYETRSLDRRMDELEKSGVAGFAVFVSGVICALWAQFTRRSAWLWFFFGLIIAPVALVTMLWKNAVGLASGELRFWTRE